MSGLIDLHCHCIPGIDDGARSLEESVEILSGLSSLGFARVVTTPHMRPGMFDNTAATLAAAFELFRDHMPSQLGLPTVELSCEHFFDDVVFRALMEGKGIPYPGGRSILLEFYATDFPLTIDHRLAVFAAPRLSSRYCASRALRTFVEIAGDSRTITGRRLCGVARCGGACWPLWQEASALCQRSTRPGHVSSRV